MLQIHSVTFHESYHRLCLFRNPFLIDNNKIDRILSTHNFRVYLSI